MKREIGLVIVLVLAGCAGTAPQQSTTDRATAAACREQANTAYALQNRDQIYRIRDPFSPQSGTGLTELPTRQLSDQFAQQQMIRDCIRNTGTATVPTGPSGSRVPAPAGGSPSGALPSSGSLSR